MIEKMIQAYPHSQRRTRVPLLFLYRVYYKIRVYQQYMHGYNTASYPTLLILLLMLHLTKAVSIKSLQQRPLCVYFRCKLKLLIGSCATTHIKVYQNSARVQINIHIADIKLLTSISKCNESI